MLISNKGFYYDIFKKQNKTKMTYAKSDYRWSNKTSTNSFKSAASKALEAAARKKEQVGIASYRQ